MVSAQAAYQGHDKLVIGNIIGSNIANALPAMAVGLLLIRQSLPSNVNASLGLLAVTLIATFFLSDAHLSRWEAGLLLAIMLPSVWLIHRHAHSPSTAEQTSAPARWLQRGILPQLLMLPVYLIILLISAEWLVTAATEIARTIGVDEQIIGLTLLAIGTSMPEIAAAAAAARQGETRLLLAGLLGSNFINLVTVLGIAGLIMPLQANVGSIWRDLAMMCGATAVLCLLAIRPLSPRAGRYIAAAMILAYLLYLSLLICQTMK